MDTCRMESLGLFNCLFALVDPTRRVMDEYTASGLYSQCHRRQGDVGDRESVLVKTRKHLNPEIDRHIVATAPTHSTDFSRSCSQDFMDIHCTQCGFDHR